MITITGVHAAGSGIASDTIQAQKFFLSTYIPQIAEVYDGTINLKLDTPLFIVSPDYQTSKLQWSEKFPAESFSLTAIQLSIEGNLQETFTAWIYEADFSPHRGNPFLVEILTRKLDFYPGACFHVAIPRTDAQTISAIVI